MKEYFSDDVKTSSKISQLNSDVLEEAVEIAKKMKKAIIQGEEEAFLQELTKNRERLYKLLEYLILNKDNPKVDKDLLNLLTRVFKLDKKKEKSEEEEKFEELSKDQKALRYRQIMYEAYKILNPERIAGETSLENFISNVLVRGIEVAREYDGKQYESHFDKENLNNLEANKKNFVNNLYKSGQRGGGRGL